MYKFWNCWLQIIVVNQVVDFLNFLRVVYMKHPILNQLGILGAIFYHKHVSDMILRLPPMYFDRQPLLRVFLISGTSIGAG